MGPTETCEACGRDVAPEEARRAELTVGDMMCPTPMVFHEECYEQASGVWEASGTSCSSPDPEFPETERWVSFPGGSRLG
ncbi:MAG: hypothetical protein KY437_10070 [Actinobacteria bacterium]|nr:hypothetical protein [Actinomycetota bacterium]